MPLYDFRCTECSEEFELRIPYAGLDNDQHCPECSQLAKRIFTKAPRFMIRPDGWNLQEGDKGYDSMFSERTFTQAQYR